MRKEEKSSVFDTVVGFLFKGLNFADEAVSKSTKKASVNYAREEIKKPFEQESNIEIKDHSMQGDSLELD